jgi:hypothetical protein
MCFSANPYLFQTGKKSLVDTDLVLDTERLSKRVCRLDVPPFSSDKRPPYTTRFLEVVRVTLRVPPSCQHPQATHPKDPPPASVQLCGWRIAERQLGLHR